MVGFAPGFSSLHRPRSREGAAGFTSISHVKSTIDGSCGAMIPLYAARIAELGPRDFVKVECGACGHTEMIPPTGLVNGLRLPLHLPVLDLASRLRCRDCDAKGKAVVTVKWAASD